LQQGPHRLVVVQQQQRERGRLLADHLAAAGAGHARAGRAGRAAARRAARHRALLGRGPAAALARAVRGDDAEVGGGGGGRLARRALALAAALAARRVRVARAPWRQR